MKNEYGLDLRNLLLIGDVHGKVSKYGDIVSRHNGDSIQVGDFGFKEEHEWHIANIDPSKHKICFGNHDDTTYLNHPHSCGGWSYNEKLKLMTIRGAFSVDNVS